MPVMAVTLLFLFDGFKDHRENKQTEQRGDDDGINHGASSKGCFRSSSAPLSLYTSWLIVTWVQLISGASS